MNQVYEKVVKCYESIKDRIPLTPKVALVLGSDWVSKKLGEDGLV